MEKNKYDVSLKIIAALMAFVTFVGVLITVASKDTTLQENGKYSVGLLNTVSDFQSIIDTKSACDYDGVLESVTLLRAEYSDTLKLFTLGYTAQNRAIPMLTMGSGEKKALVVAGIHAREHLTTKYILRCIEDYCYASETDTGLYGEYDIKALLSQYTLYIVPCANPDGLEIILGNENIKKGVSVNNLSDYKANHNGVDLNRNFPLAWNSIDNGVTRPSGYYFKGYSQGSEKETKALMKLCEENDFDFFISFHVKGNCIFWGDEYNTSFNSIYKAFAEDVATAGGLLMTKPTIKAKDYGGGFENWFRHTYTKPGVCVELVDNINIIRPCNNENYVEFDKTVNYEKTKYVMAAAMQSANK